MINITKHSLLLLIDLQKAIDHPSWGERNNPDAEKCIAHLLEVWRSHEMSIIHVKHMSSEPCSHYRPGQEGNEFKAIAIPQDDEVILYKKTNSAFIDTDLLSILRERNIHDIVIVGVVTNNSIEATARMSGNLGFSTCVVSDATFTFGKMDYSKKWRSAQEVHDMSLANISEEYADILETAKVIELLKESKK